MDITIGDSLRKNTWKPSNTILWSALLGSLAVSRVRAHCSRARLFRVFNQWLRLPAHHINYPSGYWTCATSRASTSRPCTR
ncbi:hypothetical protein B0H13DRAFT_1998253 [Mycena leptocephala]|nr:hypothetical protein B0H13DRAFT_1998253 [Mycena leptocephala]